MKRCFACKQEKSLDCFSKNNKAKDKKCHKCKECQRQWRKNNIERIRKDRVLYRQKNLNQLMLTNARSRAKLKGLPFDLTLKDIIIPKKCPVLGIEIKIPNGKRDPHSPSIDRIDNSRGYVKDNIKVISWRANTLKWDATLDEIKRILKYMQENAR